MKLKLQHHVQQILIYKIIHVLANVRMVVMEIVLPQLVKIAMLLVRNVRLLQLINVDNAMKDGY